ncbi:MAG: RNA pyrophosphohydrolase [Caulobacterales bacterium]|nr:RNA pyrophosphohydrolase [Caulobacterales bacterium]
MTEATDIASGGDPFPRHRANAGVALFNAAGLVFMGQRMGKVDSDSWQMPQGGIDPGEDPGAAAVRELQEETGVPASLVAPLGAIDRWVVYDFPPHVLAHQQVKGRDWIGQKQRWFAFRFLGEDRDIDLTWDEPQEFSDWRWERLERTPDLVIAWKRDVYLEVAREFARFARAAA